MIRNIPFLLIALLVSILCCLNACIPDEDSCVDLIMNGDEIDVDCGGSCIPCVTCIDKIQNQDEKGIDCGGLNCPPCLLRNSNWRSIGDHIGAYVQSDTFKIDTIDLSFYYSDFNIKQFEIDSDSIRLINGSYIQGESNLSSIWSIQFIRIIEDSIANDTIIQSGIFEFSSDSTELSLEVIQTKPDIGHIAPTIETGFGSTNGGNNDFYYRQLFDKL